MRRPIRVEPVKTWTFWGVVGRLIKFPFQLFAGAFAFIMLFCWIFLAWMPMVAYTSGSDVFSMTLRCFDYSTDRPANPLFLIQGNTYQVIAYSLRRPNQSAQNPGQKPEVFQESKRLVHALWDMNDPVQRKAVLDWGDSLMRLGLFESKKLDKSAPVTNFAPAAEDEAMVMIAMALLGLHPRQNQALYRLEQIAQEAYPDEKDRAAALAWAGTLYDRMEKLNVEFQAHLESGSNRREQTQLGHQRITAILPPRTNKTLWWLVYQYVGLTPTTRQQALDHWKQQFSSTFPADAQALGERLERERRAAGEPLPPPSPAVPWVCLVEYYLGLDRKGEQDRAALNRFYNPNSINLNRFALQFTNPSDEFFIVLFGSTALHLTDAIVGAHLSANIFVVLTVVYGLRLLTFAVIAEFFLRLHHVPAYRRYRNGRGHGSFLVRLTCYVGIPLLAWGIAFFTMPEILRPLAGSPLSMLLAIFLGVLLGGAFVGFLTRMVAILFLWFGVDVNRIWWDEIIGLTLGLGLLAYFGNDLVNLGIFAAAELLPMFLHPREPEILDVLPVDLDPADPDLLDPNLVKRVS